MAVEQRFCRGKCTLQHCFYVLVRGMPTQKQDTPLLQGQQVLAVAAGIIWRNGQFLALKRPQGKRHAGLWEFPGGKLEAGESPAAALCRELGEELGIAPVRHSHWQTVEHVYPAAPQVLVRLHFFHVLEFTGEARPLEGHEMRWLNPAEALNLPFLEADMPLVRQLAQSSAP